MYDVIICGASFAGLAVASKLRGKVLLVDKKVIGSLKSSACATPLHILEERGLEDSVLSITDKVNFTTMYGKISYRTIMPFAVFDYEELCRIYLKKLSVDFIKANIKDFKGDFVRTNKGDFSADIYVDATGWRAKLASGLDKNFINKKTLGFGIETEVNYKTDSLNFFYNPKILKNGYAWIFPSKSRSKFGVGSYLPKSNLKPSLEFFLNQYGLKIGLVRGGFMPYGQRKPVIG
ncbi:MAG: hypothetical protein KAS39_08885, partial [Actinomycetia bacterium]|nr:hypothetical protein [Actinomycetes bacterium]